MSASWALIKFKKTGNIYYGCYEGTSDSMRSHICTPEECYDPKSDCYCSISYCRALGNKGVNVFPDNPNDLDEVEIYSDYGVGFYFSAIGSESARMIQCKLDEIGELDLTDSIDGKPDWVDIFLKEN